MVGVLLSGGRNTRMPVLKGFLEVGGTTILESTLRLLKETLGKAVISANAPAKYFNFGTPVVGDVLKDMGPMGGIYSALISTGEPWVFAAACDMPFINPELVGFIAGKSARDATVPVFEGRPEPLLAAYSRTAMDYMEGAMRRGLASLRAMLDEIDTLYIEEGDVRRIDPVGRSFININTLEDYERTINAQKGGTSCLV